MVSAAARRRRQWAAARAARVAGAAGAAGAPRATAAAGVAGAAVAAWAAGAAGAAAAPPGLPASAAAPAPPGLPAAASAAGAAAAAVAAAAAHCSPTVPGPEQELELREPERELKQGEVQPRGGGSPATSIGKRPDVPSWTPCPHRGPRPLVPIALAEKVRQRATSAGAVVLSDVGGLFQIFRRGVEAAAGLRIVSQGRWDLLVELAPTQQRQRSLRGAPRRDGAEADGCSDSRLLGDQWQRPKLPLRPLPRCSGFARFGGSAAEADGCSDSHQSICSDQLPVHLWYSFAEAEAKDGIAEEAPAEAAELARLSLRSQSPTCLVYAAGDDGGAETNEDDEKKQLRDVIEYLKEMGKMEPADYKAVMRRLFKTWHPDKVGDTPIANRIFHLLRTHEAWYKRKAAGEAVADDSWLDSAGLDPNEKPEGDLLAIESGEAPKEAPTDGQGSWFHEFEKEMLQAKEDRDAGKTGRAEDDDKGPRVVKPPNATVGPDGQVTVLQEEIQSGPPRIVDKQLAPRFLKEAQLELHAARRLMKDYQDGFSCLHPRAATLGERRWRWPSGLRCSGPAVSRRTRSQAERRTTSSTSSRESRLPR
ncbi:unnamed protein product [Prorocentrum cordatum]|uniref:J domain-containing protein n=1 Tax=Prorocentrum cordatum TaxID=2364126 RepID=A0ABN9SNU5_9DINO|nr:unnamed protein product [Polarella glacialis]